MMGGDFDIIPFMAKHRNHRKNKHNGLRGGSVTVVMEPEADTEKVEAEPERTEAEAAAEAETEAVSARRGLKPRQQLRQRLRQ